MALEDLATPINSITADQTREYIKTHKEGSFTILDVRQPNEYEQEHLPGARLIPLPDLADSLKQLDPEKPLIIYCAKGGRSQVACKLLSGQGFKLVYNLAGGISAWNGLTAAGPQELHLAFLKEGAGAERMILLAYRMEDALRLFYLEAQTKTRDRELVTVFSNMASVEEKHKHSIIEICIKMGLISARDVPDITSARMNTIIEGGFDTDEFFRQNEEHLKTIRGSLALAMMVETQSLDLYLRLAGAVSDNTAKEFLLTMADMEKEHLSYMAKLFEKKG